jgi:hypothetical protein
MAVCGLSPGAAWDPDAVRKNSETIVHRFGSAPLVGEGLFGIMLFFDRAL